MNNIANWLVVLMFVLIVGVVQYDHGLKAGMKKQKQMDVAEFWLDVREHDIQRLIQYFK